MPVTPSPPETRAEPLRPPPGVDPEGFRVLVDFLQSGIGDNVLAIDRAANNTSVVLELEWRGWRLLFPGDAELKSWWMMHQRRQLRPVHFLKVSHHASRNGTPGEDLLDKILPLARTDDRPRFALVSTWPDTYSEVPDDHTVQRLRRRVDRVFSTRSVAPGQSVEIAFDG